jgi:hypothetical protein
LRGVLSFRPGHVRVAFHDEAVHVRIANPPVDPYPQRVFFWYTDDKMPDAVLDLGIGTSSGIAGKIDASLAGPVPDPEAGEVESAKGKGGSSGLVHDRERYRDLPVDPDLHCGC